LDWWPLRCLFYFVIIVQPVVFKGYGKIIFAGNVQLGYNPSPGVYSEVAYIEVRNKESKIIFGNNIYLNNTAIIIADFGQITIGNDTLIGDHVRIINSDFHNLDPLRRNDGSQLWKDVTIGDNVFIGSNVTITKGVTIGNNSVIGAASVVTNDIPSNCIASGVPAKKIRDLWN
jgi:maltose O-acetyltransferase